MSDGESIPYNLFMNFWYDPKKRAILFQIVILAMTAIFVGTLLYNTQENLESQNIATGFGFLKQEAGFGISETMIDYRSSDTYWRALKVGFLNTLKVGMIGNFLALALGIIVGIMRLSPNWMLSKISQNFIEVVRNIPLLLQLLFWYSLFTEVLPQVKEALNPFYGVFISQRGVNYPILLDHSIWPWVKASFVFGIIFFCFISRRIRLKREQTGQLIKRWPYALVLIVLLPLAVWLIGGAPWSWQFPTLGRFNFEGGAEVTPEFLALMVGLIIYTAAFNAEIVRAGILSVSKGQWEAASSLGLNYFQSLRFIILPQSFRVAIPPLTSQILNLIKNSSLAVAIGFPDFVAVANTTMNQTGQAIEGVLLIMIVYLFFSLLSSLFMNLYHKRISLQSHS